MPIFRINDQLHYFAHVPKCGGTSVETYLNQRFGVMGFQEPIRPHITQAQRWTRTMPQHVTAAELDLIIPRDWISSSFATVRHPVRRLISVFCFWRDHFRPRIPPDADFNAWCAEAIPRMSADPFRYDGHLQPQTAFVHDGARVFRLEDGLDSIPDYLDSLTGTTDGPREMPTMLVARWRANGTAPVPTKATLSLIAETYAGDFARFGYDIPQSVDAASALADLPILKATGRPPEPVKRSLRNRLYRSLLNRAGGR